MLIWGFIWGALLGLSLHGFAGLWLGALAGAIAGMTLRRTLRQEVATALAQYDEARDAQAIAEAAAQATVARRAALSKATAATAAPASPADSTPASAPVSAPFPPPMPIPAARPASAAPGAASDPFATRMPVPATIPPVPDPGFDLLPDDPAAPPDPLAQPLPAATYRAPPAPEPRPQTAPQMPPDAPPRILHPATPRARPVAEAQPDLDSLANRIGGWLFGGNTVVRIGALLLFLGLAFLVRWAVDHAVLPIELRLAAAALAGIALLGVGFRLRDERPEYAMTLQGAGVAVFYLTVFASYRLYGLLDAGTAFALMGAICALSTVIALRQDSLTLAVLGFGGGFAAPVLASTHTGSHVALFSYYALLDTAIVFIAARRSWRVLNLVGFFATFAIATIWGVLSYDPAQFASTEPFLALFFAIFLATAVLQALRQGVDPKALIDGTLVFGTPLVAFTLQARLVEGTEFGLAYTALMLGLIYLLLAAALKRRARDDLDLLVDSFTALGLGFATLAVPFALDARWTAAVWAIEGAGVFWIGLRQARWLPRAAGLLLQAIAALSFLDSVSVSRVAALPFANPEFLGAMLLALPAFLIAFWLRNAGADDETDAADLSDAARAWAAFEGLLSSPLYLLGMAWTLAAFAFDITRNVIGADSQLHPALAPDSHIHLLLLACVGCALASWRVGERLDWPVARLPARFTLLALLLATAATISDGLLLGDGYGWAIWPLALAGHVWLLHAADQREAVDLRQLQAADSLGTGLHAGGVWLAVAIVARLLWQAIDAGQLWRTDWAAVTGLVAATGVLLALLALARVGAARWPMDRYPQAYLWLGAAPVALLIALGNLALAGHSSGATRPLAYVPLLNPTDLALALSLGALALWWRRLRTDWDIAPGFVARPIAPLLFALTAFVDVNTVWLRIAHHWGGVAWNPIVLFRSPLVQLGYALLWTLLALLLMLLSRRQASRGLWMTGAALLGLTVLKLFVIDLSQAGSGERIGAFIGVGVLMLVVGYLAPMPPSDAATGTDDDEPAPLGGGQR